MPRVRRPLLALLALMLALAIGYGIRAARSQHPAPRRSTTGVQTSPAVRRSAPSEHAARTVRLVVRSRPSA